MTARSILLGFLLGLLISTFTYFNDQVIRQTFFVGSHLPVSVLGFLVLMAVMCNPLIRRFRPALAFKSRELILIAGIGLCACGWPGSSFFRTFTGVVALPGHFYGSRTGWQAQGVLSYVPGGSPSLAAGHVRDMVGLASALRTSAAAHEASAGKNLWQALSEEGRRFVDAMGKGEMPLGQTEQSAFVGHINECLERPELFAGTMLREQGVTAAVEALLDRSDSASIREWELRRFNRLVLQEAFPDYIRPMPGGSGVLLENGDAQAPAVVSLIQGWEESGRPGVGDIPWHAWWPLIRFWGVLALLFGLAAVCIVIIVQPQWKHELLPYPTAYFVQELVAHDGASPLPIAARSKLFWYGLVIVLLIHVINGLNAWFPDVPTVQLKLDFIPLHRIFPVTSWRIRPFLLNPTIVPTVVAFSFFLSTQVSFSVGISPVLYGILYSILIHNGIQVSDASGEASNFGMLRFGAYAATALMVVYIGRRYYAEVAARALGIRSGAAVPAMAAWAMRVLAGCLIALTLMCAANGLSWQLALPGVVAILICFLVMTRVNAETGIFFIQPSWLPVIAMGVLFGVQGIGPTGYFMLFMLSMIYCFDLRETVMPFIANGMYMTTERVKALPLRGIVALLVAMVLVGFGASLVSTLLLQYTHGLNFADTFATNAAATAPDRLAATLADLSSYGELDAAMEVSGFGHFAAMRPDWPMLGWIVAGALLVIACSLMRTRFAWWPLHPVVFVVWGTYFPSMYLAFSILMGWVLKMLVVRFSGARGFHTVKPLMFGIISGELLAGLLWIVVGTLYFLITGQVPKSYAVFHM